MATNTKNFINIRIQAHNNLKIYNSFKHNLRHTQKSLSSKEDSKNNNPVNNTSLLTIQFTFSKK